MARLRITVITPTAVPEATIAGLFSERKHPTHIPALIPLAPNPAVRLQHSQRLAYPLRMLGKELPVPRVLLVHGEDFPRNLPRRHGFRRAPENVQNRAGKLAAAEQHMALLARNSGVQIALVAECS